MIKIRIDEILGIEENQTFPHIIVVDSYGRDRYRFCNPKKNNPADFLCKNVEYLYVASILRTYVCVYWFGNKVRSKKLQISFAS